MLKGTYKSWSNICCHPDTFLKEVTAYFSETLSSTIILWKSGKEFSFHHIFFFGFGLVWAATVAESQNVCLQERNYYSLTLEMLQCSSKMAPSCFLCTFPQQPYKPEEINFLCSASLFCGLSLPEEIIIVFHTTPPAVGTHLDNYMQYSGEESMLHNSGNWARSREWLTAIFTSQSD